MQVGSYFRGVDEAHSKGQPAFSRQHSSRSSCSRPRQLQLPISTPASCRMAGRGALLRLALLLGALIPAPRTVRAQAPLCHDPLATN